MARGGWTCDQVADAVEWVEIGIEIRIEIVIGIAAIVGMVLVENPSSTDAWVECIAVKRQDTMDSTHVKMMLAMRLLLQQCSNDIVV